MVARLGDSYVRHFVIIRSQVAEQVSLQGTDEFGENVRLDKNLLTQYELALVLHEVIDELAIDATDKINST